MDKPKKCSIKNQVAEEYIKTKLNEKMCEKKNFKKGLTENSG